MIFALALLAAFVLGALITRAYDNAAARIDAKMAALDVELAALDAELAARKARRDA